MLIWGLILVAIGIGALVDVNWGRYWGAILLVSGGALLASTVLTPRLGRRYSNWLWTNCCFHPVLLLDAEESHQPDRERP